MKDEYLIPVHVHTHMGTTRKIYLVGVPRVGDFIYLDKIPGDCVVTRVEWSEITNGAEVTIALK